MRELGEDMRSSRSQPVLAEDRHTDAEPSALARRFGLPRGPVRTLCDEIGFAWDARLERADVFTAFVREVASEVDRKHNIQQLLADRLGQPGPSEGSAEVLALVTAMLAAPTVAEQVALADQVHEAARRLNPDDAYPTDHLIDMLSSCASAIRFGLGDAFGLGSRHAAEAANHVWKHVYGVSLFDQHTGNWEKDWARSKLTGAVLSLLPPLADAAPQARTETGEK